MQQDRKIESKDSDSGLTPGLFKPETQLRSVLDSLLEGFQVLSFDWKYLYLNAAAARHRRLPAEELLGRGLLECNPTLLGSELLGLLQKCMAERSSARTETRYVYPDGSAACFELSIQPVAEGLCVFSFDTSERCKARDALDRSAALLARAQEIARIHSYETGFLSEDSISPMALALPRGVPECGAGQLHPADAHSVLEAAAYAARAKSRFEREYRIVQPDGSVHYVHNAAEPLSQAFEDEGKFVGAIQDVTDRMQLEQEILRISEQEQSRIGQELHDGLCQALAAVEFRLHAVSCDTDVRSRPVASMLGEIGRMVRDAIEQSRAIARGLSPVPVGPEGLSSALLDLAKRTERVYGVRTCFDEIGTTEPCGNDTASHLFRIAQEAVRNAISHGAARNILIQLASRSRGLALTIQDDGTGAAQHVRDQNGMGLRLMRYRANLIGASLSIGSRAAGGVEVRCSLPRPAGEPAVATGPINERCIAEPSI